MITAVQTLPAPAGEDLSAAGSFAALFEARSIQTVFQPIIRIGSGELMGYETLTRPLPASGFASADALFDAAARLGQRTQFELRCAREGVEAFVRLGLQGRLLINLSPECIVEGHARRDPGMDFLMLARPPSGTLAVELTEQKTPNVDTLREALTLFRSLGVEVALDDLGQGFSSLWLWSELHPELVKVDRHFVSGIHKDPIKFQFLKALQQIAEGCGSRLIAEGIEDLADLLVLRDLGIEYGQGYLIARPAYPPPGIGAALVSAVRARGISVFPEVVQAPVRREAGGDRLVVRYKPVTPSTTCDEVLEIFEQEHDAVPHALAVVDGDRPCGLINRNEFVAQYVRRYRKELFGKRSCTAFMDPHPLLVDRRMSIHDISEVLTRADPRHLSAGFIVIDGERYLGIAAGQDLIREITAMQIEAARYANPLTLLPGNVPIDEHIERLLSARVGFVAAYSDLNYFKSFNDNYGYRQGDLMIKSAARCLAEVCEPRTDFIGHIGGDDFILLFQSLDWERRCQRALHAFATDSQGLFDAETRARGHLVAMDRQGQTVRFPLTSLAIGAVIVEPGVFASHMHVSAAANEAKKRAKMLGGNTVFVERRRPA